MLGFSFRPETDRLVANSTGGNRNLSGNSNNRFKPAVDGIDRNFPRNRKILHSNAFSPFTQPCGLSKNFTRLLLSE